MSDDRRACPYVGLAPFTEADRAFFYGRERDQQVIASNLYASPLTILYGASGVGKSSALLAGVVPELRATPRVAIVVFREWQGADALRSIKRAAVAEVARVRKRPIGIREDQPLDELLIECANAVRGPVFVILDQFEEYFLYHPSKDEPFDAELARAVNRRDVDANFLIGMREDGLSNLDRLQGRIPNLLGNMLRLEHLDRSQAERAIEKPLELYAKETHEGHDGPRAIEPPLVSAIIDEVQAGRMRGAQRSTRRPETEARIETTYLQMVLMRLWKEETHDASKLLRLDTLRRLGGAERIVSTHLDDVMTKLTPNESEVAARVLRYLVTPGGSKIAYLASDLAAYADVPEPQVQRVLERLARPEARVLRPIADPLSEDPKAVRYEIFHDVLAQAVLDWRARADVLREQQRFRRWTAWLAGMLFITILVAAYTLNLWSGAKVDRETAVAAQVEAYTTRDTAEEARQKAEEAKRRADESTKLLAQLASPAAEERDDAVKDLKEMLAKDAITPEVAGVIAGLVEPRTGAQQVEAAKVVAQAAQAGKVDLPRVGDASTRPKVYIYLANEAQQQNVGDLAAALDEQSLVVPTPRIAPKVGPPRTQVRYFFAEDEEGAKQLAAQVKRILGAEVELVSLPNLGFRVRPKLFELWMGPNELKAQPAVTPPRVVPPRPPTRKPAAPAAPDRERY